MMTFLTKNIMTLICQIEFDIKNIWMIHILHVEIHTQCVRIVGIMERKQYHHQL